MTLRRLFRFDEKKRFMLALIAPAVLVLVFFQILPILTGTNASFRDWHLHDPQEDLDRPHQLRLRAARRRLPAHRAAQHLRLHVRQRRLLADPGPADRAAAQPQVPGPLAGADHHPAAADGGAGHRRHHDPLDVQRPVRHRERDPRRVRHPADRLADAEVDGVPGDPADRRVAVDAVVRAAAAGRPAEPAARAVRGRPDRRAPAPGARSATSRCRCCAR